MNFLIPNEFLLNLALHRDEFAHRMILADWIEDQMPGEYALYAQDLRGELGDAAVGLFLHFGSRTVMELFACIDTVRAFILCKSNVDVLLAKE